MINLKYLFNRFQCGHYCLKYIFKQNKLKLKCNYNKNFMSIYEITLIFEKHHFNYNAFKCNNLNNLQTDKSYLSLLKVKDSFHYIVILNYDEKYVYYYDPIFIIIRKKRLNKFKIKWSKICIEYESI